MATKMKRKMHKKQITIPLAVVAGFIPMGKDAWDNRDAFGGIAQSAMHSAAGALVAYDTVGKKFNLTNWKQAGGPAIWAGFGVHYAAQKLGLNRMIARAGIPLIRI